MRPLLEMMLAPESEGKSLSEFLAPEVLRSWETRGVVWLARALGLRSIAGDPLATTYTTDLFAFLDRLPPKTATALYLGFLAAAYLDGEAALSVPRAPWLTQLFRLQAHPRAANAIRAFRAHLTGRGNHPVYIPDPAMPALPVKPLLEAVKRSVPRLNGLQINEIGVIVEAQIEEERRLVNRFPGREAVTISDVVGEVCSMLGIPIDQIERTDALDREVSFGPTVGIASPSDLQNDTEDQA